MNPSYVRRLLQLHGRRVLSNTMGGDDGSFHDEVRRLNEEVPVAILEDTGEELNEIFTEYEDGVIPVISVEVEGTTYTGSVASGKNKSVNAGEQEKIHSFLLTKTRLLYLVSL